MWDEGLIYRGERLVNFCTFHDTAFADIEVIHREETGHLWHIRYPLIDGSGEVVVATTRPETMLGDTAVAVNPADERYSQFVGKTVKLPLTSREIPIIADTYVDMKFGTGAVKITPAHDINDFEVGKRHDLPMITIISHDGRMENVSPAYEGLDVAGARKLIVSELEEQGMIVETEEHVHSVGHCYKCDTIIQPLLREQWFVSMQPLAKGGIKALKDDRINFYPSNKKSQLINYLEGLRDWNISRQIAWGIPIPAFQNIDEPDDWIYDERVDEQLIIVEGKTYRRDPDVFDTWFSSSSWPYASLEYPDNELFKQFYPLSLMETGGEILYPWVSRMLLLGLYVTGEIPFKEVYIHGYVMAEDGSKMSKSIGNVVDPLPLITKYGSDALRMGIISGRAAGINRGFDIRKVEEARNFCNKLWNVARYIENVVKGEHDFSNAQPNTAADNWILSELKRVSTVNYELMDSYRFSEAYDNLYHFVWDELADWYIEASKANQNKNLLAYILKNTLLLMHPFAPFLTETIWQSLEWEKDSLIAVQQLNDVMSYDKALAEEFSEVQLIVREVRYILKALKVNGISMHYRHSEFVAKHSTILMQLTPLTSVDESKTDNRLELTSTNRGIWLDVDPLTARNYANELAVKRSEQERIIDQLNYRLANKNYINNAPEQVVQQTRNQLAATKDSLNSLKNEIDRFK
jgi:valyl-tRNA synthetase